MEEVVDPHTLHCYDFFTALYKGVNGGAVSRATRKNMQENSALIYGEVEFLPFADMLTVVKPQSGEVFYDLGCGAGKAIFAMALLYDNIECHGVELLKPLCHLCREQLDKFYKLQAKDPFFKSQNYEIHFKNGDLLDVDFTKPDIIFINATTFIGEFWDTIVSRFQQCKVGTRVILCSRTLDAPFELLDDKSREMSWGLNSIHIYRKTA